MFKYMKEYAYLNRWGAMLGRKRRLFQSNKSYRRQLMAQAERYTQDGFSVPNMYKNKKGGLTVERNIKNIYEHLGAIGFWFKIFIAWNILNSAGLIYVLLVQ